VGIRARRWLLATYVLGLAAIALQIAAQRAISQGLIGRAKIPHAKAEGAAETVLESMRQRAHTAADRGSELSLIGLGLAALGGLSLLLSTVNQEPGWRLLAAAVLFAYVLISLIMV
jgi:hypothetical protein